VSNLQREGITDGVRLTGDVMLDLALQTKDAALARPLPQDLREGRYFVATIHRASNTDDPARLERIVAALEDVARHVAPVLLPLHPRLAEALRRNAIRLTAVHGSPPVGYLEMQGLILRSRAVITDSGGVQKEALFHGKQCLTLRDSTEWLESVQSGLNVLVGDNLSRLRDFAEGSISSPQAHSEILDLFGGGSAAYCIAECLVARGTERQRWRALRDVP